MCIGEDEKNFIIFHCVVFFKNLYYCTVTANQILSYLNWSYSSFYYLMFLNVILVSVFACVRQFELLLCF